ncbi:dTDP-4-dehydrorhamnose reductase [Leeia aquatica]|nr:dTDP-4-dehydrorhamnose reductase [Leeia aquatica]
MAVMTADILLTGVTGQVGFELARTLSTLGKVWAPTRTELDLLDPIAVAAAVRGCQPRWIVNAAAYTAVDKAETERDLSRQLNTALPGELARLAHELGCGLVHFSTDYVFAGEGEQSYRETDPCQPLNAYGADKHAGEQAILASGAAALIFRTSWVYGNRGRNFMLTMLRLAAEKPELAVVADQIGAPTWSRHIAEAVAQVLVQVSPTTLGERAGIYHLVNGGETSWHGFASAIVAQSGFSTPVRPITSQDFPSPARRPANSRLSCDKLAEVFSIRLPDWQTGLQQCLQARGLA